MTSTISDSVLLQTASGDVPRYTSYPTAPRFSDAVDAESYRTWLGGVAPEAELSLYLHVPFCRQLCWYCGCHTRIVHRAAPVDAYLDALSAELAMVAAALPGSVSVGHLHWGGGTPTLLEPEQIRRLSAALRRDFRRAPDADFAVEIDPRGFDEARATALAEAGVTRASLGVQDLNLGVQQAINRVQSLAETAAAAALLRRLGIEGINLDLMYGLPHQTVGDVLATIEQVLALAPSRIALFGYAHVPWLKKHQRRIEASALPNAAERLTALQAAAGRLTEAGYVAIGLDHFALPDDGLARAVREGRLRRNFQGYTSDRADVLLGFGASAIGRLREGYVQNAVAIPEYVGTIRDGRLATRRGLAISADDRMRADVIERLMCDLRVDLAAVGARHGRDVAAFGPELDALSDFAAEGLVRLEDGTVRVLEPARPVLRSIAAVFDRYLDRGIERHSAAM